jgi:uroporphyrinogen decarboxylase
MNHRDRVLAALSHQEADRVPLDFGGTGDSTISALSYQTLRRRLGLKPSVTRVQDVFQYTAVIEDDVRQAMGIDTAPVLDEPLEWREGTLRDPLGDAPGRSATLSAASRGAPRPTRRSLRVLRDGSPALFPARFLPEALPDGSQVTRDAQGTVVLKMPAGGLYFDPVHSPLARATSARDIDDCLGEIEGYDRPAHLDMEYEALAERAKALRENSDYLLVGFFGGHIFQAAQSLRGWELFLMDLMTNRAFAEALLDRLVEANIRRFERYASTVGRYVDVVHFEDDLGMQDRPLLRPQLYRDAVKPYHAKLFAYARASTDAYLLFHTDGAVAAFMADFVEMGIDAVNPVQVSAAGMDTRELKREFGREVTFWGGGCDSQTVLPLGTPGEVADEVKRRMDDLSPGGGFVFSPIHNVQADVPVENVVAMFDTARTCGQYG